MRCRARGEDRAGATREMGGQTAQASGRPGTRVVGERPAEGGAKSREEAGPRGADRIGEEAGPRGRGRG